MVEDVKHLINHLLGKHNNSRCIAYGKCQQPDYRASFQATTDKEKAVLKE